MQSLIRSKSAGVTGGRGTAGAGPGRDFLYDRLGLTAPRAMVDVESYGSNDLGTTAEPQPRHNRIPRPTRCVPRHVQNSCRAPVTVNVLTPTLS